ncbi:MAG: hypothetical protein AAFY20_27015, partial [Cyanobacteria bacterium J06639_14]
RQRLRQLQYDYGVGRLSLVDLVQRLQSWEAHLLNGDTQHLRRDIFNQLVFHPPPLSAEGENPGKKAIKF